MVLNIIWMIILGLIVGWIARLIVPGKNFGWIATALLGIIGGYVGGTLGSLVFARTNSPSPRRSITPSSARWWAR